jgi:two-component system, NarL family, sensor kinase
MVGDPGSARTGVRLSAMRERAEGLGGDFEVRSRPGRGTEITVRIRLAGGTPDPGRL